MTAKTLVIVQLIVILGTAAGCTPAYREPHVSLQSQAGDFVMDPKIDLSVNLCLPEDLRAAKWENVSFYERRLALGGLLVNCSTELGSFLFKKVVVTSLPVSKDHEQVDAILTPRIVVLSKSMLQAPYRLTIVVVWKLEDTQGNIVWAQSIKGQVNVVKFERNGGVEAVMKDLFRKTFEAMKSSPEIQQFAARQHPRRACIEAEERFPKRNQYQCQCRELVFLGAHA